MSTDPHAAPRPLPDRPNLRHLKDQAKDLVKAGTAKSITRCAVQDRPPLWVSELAEAQGPCRFTRGDRAAQAGDRHQRYRARQDADDAEPGAAPRADWLWQGRTAHMGRRMPGAVGAAQSARLAMAKWMIENGSDVHQGGDGPLMRAALNGDRIPMMELLVSYGADVNAEWHGDFPIIFAPCEAVDPQALKWLLDHGANPNCDNRPMRGTALDYVIGTYARSPERLSACIDVLLDAGGTTRYNAPGVLEVLRRPARSLGGATRRGSGAGAPAVS